MYYTIYQITNKINGKIYIGSHKTKNLNDGYMGSGKYLTRAIKKNGVENFEKEILHIFDNAKDMYDKEAELVNEEFITEANTYNLKKGGFGGFDYINEIKSNRAYWDNLSDDELSQQCSENGRKGGYISKERQTGIFTKESRKKATKCRQQKYPNGTFFARTHTNETKRVISQKAKERLKDLTKNSQYGTMWITDGTTNQKIKKESFIPDGWYKGRTM